MFIVRSLFWLTAAFMVIAPQVDVAERARSAPMEALSATQAAVTRYAPHLACDSFECVAARTLLASSAPAMPVARDIAAAPAPPGTQDAIGNLIATRAPSTVPPVAPTPVRRPAALL